MNDPKPRIEPDNDIGALDENGEQIWSPELEETVRRYTATPEYRAAIAEAEADIAAGRVYSHEEVVAHSAERRRRWLADRGL